MIGLLYIVLGIFIVFTEIVRILNHEKLNYLTIFKVYFIGYYIVPASIHNLMPSYRSRYSYALASGEGTFTAFIAIFLAFLFVWLGYSKNYVFGRKSEYRNRIYYIENEERFFSHAIVILWMLGIVSFIFHCYSYGGITKAIFNSALIRNGEIESTASGSLLFISKFVSCLMYASYLVFIKYLRKNTNIVVFAFSLILAAIYLLVNAGRGAIILYCITMVFIYISVTGKKIKISTWIMMFAIVLLGVTYLRPLLISMTNLKYGIDAFFDSFMSSVKSNENTAFTIENLLYRLCYYLEHKYVSTEIAIEAIRSSKYSYSFFIVDIFVALIAVIPEAILPFKKPETISYYNTLLIGENAKYKTGTIPPGSIGFGYYSMGLIGVGLYSFIFGVCGRKLVNFFDCFDSKYIEALKFVNCFIWIDFFINGDLRQCVVRNFVFIMLLIAIKIKKRSVYEDAS